jgi:hypothetical protein
VVTDPPVSAGHIHNPDYTTLFGELHHDARQGVWRLRYAPLGEEDRYGGSVTLDSSNRMMLGFKDGQRVRVQGALADPESHDLHPTYRVRDITPVAE